MKEFDNDRFDRLVKQKIHEVNFAVDDVHKEAIFGQLDQQKHTHWWIYGIATGLMVFSVIGWYFMEAVTVDAPPLTSYEQTSSVTETGTGVISCEDNIIRAVPAQISNFEQPAEQQSLLAVIGDNAVRQPHHNQTQKLGGNRDIIGIKSNSLKEKEAFSHAKKSFSHEHAVAKDRIEKSKGQALKYGRGTIVVSNENKIKSAGLSLPSFEITPVYLKRSKRKPIHIFMDVAPFLTYQRVLPNVNDDIEVRAFRSPSRLSTERLGLKLLIGAEIPVSKRLSYIGGISVQNWHLQFSYVAENSSELTFSVDTTKSLGIEDFDASSAENVINEQLNNGGVIALDVDKSKVSEAVNATLYNVGFMSGLKIRMGSGKLYHDFVSALEWQQLLNKDRLNNLLTTDVIRKNQLILNLQYATLYELNKRIFFKVSPSLNYSLLKKPNEGGGLFNIQPFSAGLSVGVQYRIK